MSDIKLNSKVFTTGETSKVIKAIGRGEFHKNSKELVKQFNPTKSLNGIYTIYFITHFEYDKIPDLL